MYVDIDAGDVEVTNETRIPWSAVRKPSSNWTEVWEDDYEHQIGILPLNASPDQIADAVRFYRSGYERGKLVGASNKAYEIRRVLEIVDPLSPAN